MSVTSFEEMFLDFSVKIASLGIVYKIFIIFLGVTFIAAVFTFLKNALHRHKYSKLLPGKPMRFLGLLGNFTEFPGWLIGYRGYNFNVYFLQLACGYLELFKKEALCCFWVSYVPFVLVAKAEAVEATIAGTKMMQKGWSYHLLQPWLGTGLLTSHGSKWKSRRKLLTPSFHFEILKDFLPVFNEQSQVLIKQLQAEVTKDFTDIVMPVTLCSLDIICETTLGVTIGAQANSESRYVKSVTRTSELIMERMVNYLQWIDFIYYNFMKEGKELKKELKVLHNFTRMVIQEKKRKLLCGAPEETVQRKRKALMDLLLEHHVKTKELSEEDIREEVDTFAFEGHDTTSMGISWALYLIGSHPDVQEKVHEEMDRIFGKDGERFADNDDLKDMVYLDRVLKESQRLFPSVPFMTRHVEEDTDICGHIIPKGSSVMVITYHLHRDAKFFPNPEKFDPDRFLPENSASRHPFAYIPFSAGPRNCIGQRFALMEEKIVVSTIMRNFKLESLDPRDQLPPAPELILRTTCPIRIRIRPRQFV